MIRDQLANQAIRMKTKILLITAAVSCITAACGLSGSESSLPIPNNTVVEASRPIADPVDGYIVRTSGLMTRMNTVTERVLRATTNASEQAKAAWIEDPSKTNLAAVRPPSSKPVVLDTLSTEEIVKALNTRAKPFIPQPLLDAITELIAELDRSADELEKLSKEWESLPYPTEAWSWRNAQIDYLDATRTAYQYTSITRTRFVELGAVPEMDTQRMNQAFDVQGLALQMAELTSQLMK